MFSPQKFCRNWATHLFKVLNVSSCSHGNKNLTQVVPIRQIEAIDPLNIQVVQSPTFK